MNLPIEFTTTLKEEKLISYHRRQALRRFGLMVLFLIPLVAMVAIFTREDGQAFPYDPTTLLTYAIPLGLILLIWLILTYFMSAANVRRLAKIDPSLLSVRAFVINAETISHYGEASSGEFRWSLLRGASVGKDYVTLQLHNNSFFLIDPADLEEQQLRDLKKLLIEKEKMRA